MDLTESSFLGQASASLTPQPISPLLLLPFSHQVCPSTLQTPQGIVMLI